MGGGRQISGLIRRLVTGIGLPIVIVDPKKHTVSFVNPAFEDLCGRPQRDVRGSDATALFSKATQERIAAICEVMGKGGTRFMEEQDCDLVRRTGRKIPVNILASRVHLGSQNWIVLSLHDLSTIRKLQAQRETDLKEMAQVSKLADIGLLAAGVAHELNNPLMIVQGFAENLEMLLDLPQPELEELKTQTGEILKAADRMNRIISQMTRMVRSTDVKFEVVDLQELTQNVLRFINHEVKYSNANVVTAYAEANLVKCDHNQVEQVIMNILNNALHALTLRADERELRISCSHNDGWVELRLWNNGPPIPAEIQDKIMTPFFTTKEVGKGTGLGLAVSFGIMKAHGGSLSFKSNGREGTEFTLRFPKPDILPVEVRPQHLNRAILLVDDDPAALDVLANKVRPFGYQILKVRSGAEAFHSISNHPSIVAVFTDLRMPDMDGLTLCRHIRQFMNPGPAIFAVTGYGLAPSLESELKAAGVTGILTKPINHNAFSALMFALYSRKSTG